MYAAVNGNQAMDLERDDLQGADDLVVKADERRMEMRRGKIIAVSLTVCAVGAGMTVNAYAASTTFEMRKKAVSLLGIITTSNYQANVTRGEFAELLVKASDYKEAATRREPYLYSWMSPQIPVFCGDPHGGDELLDVRLSRRKL